MRDAVITRKVVKKEVSKLKQNKSPGPDEFFPRVLKEYQEVLNGSLTGIFKMSINSG